IGILHNAPGMLQDLRSRDLSSLVRVLTLCSTAGNLAPGRGGRAVTRSFAETVHEQLTEIRFFHCPAATGAPPVRLAGKYRRRVRRRPGERGCGRLWRQVDQLSAERAGHARAVQSVGAALRTQLLTRGTRWAG